MACSFVFSRVLALLRAQEYVAAHKVSDEAHEEEVAQLAGELAAWKEQHSVSDAEHRQQIEDWTQRFAAKEADLEAAQQECADVTARLESTQDQVCCPVLGSCWACWVC